MKSQIVPVTVQHEQLDHDIVFVRFDGTISVSLRTVQPWQRQRRMP